MTFERHYRMGPVLGEGGFATVYRAARVGPGGFSTDVAIKLLHADLSMRRTIRERLADEARLLGLLNHDHIVRVQEFIEIDGAPAVVMDYVEGVDLGEAVERLGPMPARAAAEVAATVAGALAYARSREDPRQPGQPLELVHRDLKPDNLVLTSTGVIRVLDFGISKANFAARQANTRAGRFGTPSYMAPEQHWGKADGRTDVFAVGATLVHLLTGRPPGETGPEEDGHEVWRETAFAALAAREVPAPLVDLIEQATRYDLTLRPDAAALRVSARRAADVVHGASLASWAEGQLDRLVSERRSAQHAGPLTGMTVTGGVTSGHTPPTALGGATYPSVPNRPSTPTFGVHEVEVAAEPPVRLGTPDTLAPDDGPAAPGEDSGTFSTPAVRPVSVGWIGALVTAIAVAVALGVTAGLLLSSGAWSSSEPVADAGDGALEVAPDPVAPVVAEPTPEAPPAATDAGAPPAPAPPRPAAAVARERSATAAPREARRPPPERPAVVEPPPPSPPPAAAPPPERPAPPTCAGGGRAWSAPDRTVRIRFEGDGEHVAQVDVREGTSVTLKCRHDGRSTPFCLSNASASPSPSVRVVNAPGTPYRALSWSTVERPGVVCAVPQ